MTLLRRIASPCCSFLCIELNARVGAPSPTTSISRTGAGRASYRCTTMRRRLEALADSSRGPVDALTAAPGGRSVLTRAVLHVVLLFLVFPTLLFSCCDESDGLLL